MEVENVESFSIIIRLLVNRILNVRIICIRIIIAVHNLTIYIDYLMFYDELHLNDLFDLISFIDIVLNTRK